MHEFVWIAVGIAIALVAMRLRRMFACDPQPASGTPVRRGAADAPDRRDAGDRARQGEPRGDADAAPPTRPATFAPNARRLALSLADELASLVSGVEGRAHHLIEAAPTRTQLPAAAEALLAAVHRLRTLHAKLFAFGQGRQVEPGETDVVELIAGLGGELQHMQLGLELRWEPPPDLPRIAASPAAARDALLFLCAALLRAERGATRLTFVAERSFTEELPQIDVELTLEWITPSTGSEVEAVSDDAFALDLEAANHLITSHGGELSVAHLPGKSVRAVVRLPVATGRPEPEPVVVLPTNGSPADQQPPLPHHYGGALVLESDPQVRAVLAGELKASGRAVFACADGASAHTFLQATPDRFELLIVDDASQLEDSRPLARTIRALAPALKICVLTPTPASPRPTWPDLHYLQKPFGVLELRRTLATMMTAS